MAVTRPQLQQRIPFVDGQGRLSNEGLRALNDALGSLFSQIQQIAELYGITDALNSDLATLASSGVVLASPGGFPSGRVFTSTPTIAVTDGGSMITADFNGDTDDVPEGGNLYYTDARARAAHSSGSGINYNSASGVIALAVNGVTDAHIRQSSAFSIIGRSGNTTGDVADITAAADGQVLRRSGSVLGFGAVDLSSAGGVAGILPASKGGTGVTANTGTGNNVLSSLPTFGATIGVGNASASASGSGISFPATQSPSTDPNTLDDYEEGTWTPTLSASSGTITTVGAVSGIYTKIGRLVIATIDATITTNGTAAGTLRASLPFTAANELTHFGTGRESAVSFAQLVAFTGFANTNMNILKYDNSYPGADGARIQVTIGYIT